MLKTMQGSRVWSFFQDTEPKDTATLLEQTGLQLHYGTEAAALAVFSPAAQTPAKPVSPAQQPLGVTEEQQNCL